jgi:hypothetical protein
MMLLDCRPWREGGSGRNDITTTERNAIGWNRLHGGEASAAVTGVTPVGLLP